MCTSGPVPDREASGMITSKPLWKWRGCGKRGKPKAGFPLFHAPVRDDDSCLFLSKLPGTYHNHRKENTRRARKALAGHRDFRLTPHWNQMSVSGSSRTGIKLRFQAHFWIGKCCRPHFHPPWWAPSTGAEVIHFPDYAPAAHLPRSGLVQQPFTPLILSEGGATSPSQPA